MMKLTTRKLVVVAMLAAVSIILGLTPLGFIPVPFSPAKATIMHIPVIIGSIMEGPIVGAIVGLVFGVFSIYQAVVMPTNPAQFVFLDPVVAILPRVLIAFTSYYIYILIIKVFKARMRQKPLIITASAFAGAVGTLTNTLGVLSAIYFRHGVEYAEKLGIEADTVGKFIVGIGITNGIPEIIVAIIVVSAVVQALQRLYNKH